MLSLNVVAAGGLDAKKMTEEPQVTLQLDALRAASVHLCEPRCHLHCVAAALGLSQTHPGEMVPRDFVAFVRTWLIQAQCESASMDSVQCLAL
jgi:hypothetical protein